MSILNKNKFEVEQKSFTKTEKSEDSAFDKSYLSELIKNPSNKVLLAVVGVFFVILLSGFIFRSKNGEVSMPVASNPAVSVSKRAETKETASSYPEASETSGSTISGVYPTAETTIITVPTGEGLDRLAINNEIFKAQSAIANKEGKELVLYPIPHTENPKIPIADISKLPSGQVVGYKDSDTLYIALNDKSGTITVNLAGIRCTPPGGATGALAVSNWFNEVVTEADPPFKVPGSNYVYIEYAAEAPTMSDGSYNAYIWLISSFNDGETVCLNEWMLKEGFAEPDPFTANRKYYEYFKVYPYTYQDVQ